MPLYPQMWAKVSGVLLFENQDLEIDQPDNDTDVDTVLGGAAGISPGPSRMMINVTNAVKAAGTDINLSEAKQNRTELQIEIGRIGSAATITGAFYCRSVNFRSGTAQATIETATFSSVGKVPPVPNDW